MLIVVPLESGVHNAGAVDESDQPLTIVVAHDGQVADVVPQHEHDGATERFIFTDDYQFARSGFSYG
jgi:hypothetical protein